MECKRIAVFPVEGLKAARRDDGGMYVEGTITTQDVDRQGERMRVGGLSNLAEYMANPIVRWQHGEPIGHAVEVHPLKTQIRVVDKLAPTRLVGETVWPLVENGSVRSFSIGFLGHEGVEGKDGAWEWTAWELLEHSLVDIPANPKAAAQVVKSLAEAHGYESGPLSTKGAVAVKHPPAEDLGRAWDAAAADRRVRRWAEAEESPNERYRGCHLWYDAASADLFSSYKLLVCDVIDGEPRVIWRALVAAAGALKGARGGVDLPEGDRERVWSQVETLYGKFDKEPPEKASGPEGYKSGEKLILEVNLFGERLKRLCGAAQGAHDIAVAWQRAGVTPEVLGALTAEELAQVGTACERLDEVRKALRSGSEPAEGEGAIEAALAALEAADPATQALGALGLG